jgi:hypothetical protein
MSEFLFSYGTLQDPRIQEEIIGRTLLGESDVLENFWVSDTLLEGLYLVGERKIGHHLVGIVSPIVSEDLIPLDIYEGDAYKRVKVSLQSSKKAWVYIGKK